MNYTSTDNKNVYILQATTLKERLRLAWNYIRHPTRYQIRTTFNDGETFIIKNCKPIMNETKNLVKVRE